jgi:hypothetical protein
MATDVTYFMGQGKCYIAPRVTNGAIAGAYTYVGDVSKLALAANQKFDDVEESVSGSRLVAAHIPNGLSYNASMVCEQWSAHNLLMATYGGGRNPVDAGTVVAEIVKCYAGPGAAQGGGAMIPLANPGVSAVVAVLAGAATAVGSVVVNAKGTSSLAAGTRVTCGLVGNTSSVAPVIVAVIANDGTGGVDHYEVTTPGTSTVLPTSLTVAGVTSPTQYINAGGVSLTLTTDYTVDAANGAITSAAGSQKLPLGNMQDITGVNVSVNYSFAAYNSAIEGILTGNGIQEYAIRFHGLNTANGNSPVIVNLWRYSMNLAKTLDFIASKHGTLDLDGMLLPDSTRNGTTQSQFFSILKV